MKKYNFKLVSQGCPAPTGGAPTYLIYAAPHQSNGIFFIYSKKEANEEYNTNIYSSTISPNTWQLLLSLFTISPRLVIQNGNLDQINPQEM
jgi:hypothetical protein